MIEYRAIFIAFYRFTQNYLTRRENIINSAYMLEVFILKFNSSLIYSMMNLIVNQEIGFYKNFMSKKYRKKVIINAKLSLCFMKPNISS